MDGKQDLIAGLSHEFRSPLTSIIGFSEILLKNEQGSFTKQEIAYLEGIRRNSLYLFSLVNSILEIARLENKSFERLSLQEIDVGALVHAQVQMIEGQAIKKNISLIEQIPLTLDPMITDKEKLSIILSNFLSNAIKYTKKGKVVVRVIKRMNTNQVERIEVQDTGEGISIEGQKKLFSPFSQTKKEHMTKGFGLGLAIAKSLAELLKAQIVVESRVGKGSTFSLVFGIPLKK
jgi:signal transduction histidine kinase